MVEHPTSGCVEVVDAKEQPDSASVLVADRIDLSPALGLSEQEPGQRVRWPDDDPTLRTAVVRGRWRVFDEVETQCVNEESDRVVVVVDDQRGVLDVHTPTLRGRASRRRYAAGARSACVLGQVRPVSNTGHGLESRFASASVWPEQRGALGIDLSPGRTTGQVVVDDAQGLHRRVHGRWSDEAEPAL